MRKILFLPHDIYSKFFGINKDLPLKGEIYTGGGDFKASGEKFKNLVVQNCNLSESGSILDIGSGIGRLALPLSSYMSPKGKYEGFDVIEKGIEWCKKNIGKNYPNFNFTYVPLENDLYTETGHQAKDFVFPYASKSFDCTIAISVYTHLLKEELEQYLRESKRVMKPGAKSLATFFIFSENDQLLRNSKFQFKYNSDGQWLMDEKVMRANVAFEKEYLLGFIENELGLKVETVQYGNWSDPDNTKAVDFQDIIIFSKR